MTMKGGADLADVIAGGEGATTFRKPQFARRAGGKIALRPRGFRYVVRVASVMRWR